jgi:glycosyltransferase involved in cell wall biosynthesis
MRCLFAGRLIGLKGVDLGLRAVARARARGADVMMTIVGQGPMRERLAQMARELGLEQHVTFIDWLSRAELFEQYRSHDLLLFPSLHDSSGNVLLEAFAHGLPAVCLALGGPGIMVDPACGIAVDVRGRSREGVSAALAEALVALATDRFRLNRMGNEARKRACASSWDAVVRRTYAHLQTV